MTKKIITLHQNTHFVLQAEKELKEQGFPVEPVPIPAQLRSKYNLSALCQMGLLYETDQETDTYLQKVKKLAGISGAYTEVGREKGLAGEEWHRLFTFGCPQ